MDITVLLYDRFTALDCIGPYELLSRIPGARLRFIAKKAGPVVTDTGMLSCYNAKTGEPYYQQVRLPKSYNFKSSPVGVNGKLYMASENEDVIVVKMGEKFEVLATNTMKDQVFIATPAIVGGEICLRSKTSLFCIRGK